MGNQIFHCNDDTKQLTKELEILKDINRQEYFTAIPSKLIRIQKIRNIEANYQLLGKFLIQNQTKPHLFHTHVHMQKITVPSK